MQSLKVLIITCLLFLALVSARAPPTKLQVGVKHRPETCERKTRNGDRLAMHCKILFIDLLITNYCFKEKSRIV